MLALGFLFVKDWPVRWGGISQYAWSPCHSLLLGTIKNVSRYFYISLWAEAPLDYKYLPRVILVIGQV